MINDCQAKPRIEYPCPWLFKVIGFDTAEIRRAIAEVVGGADTRISPSRVSSSGKYHSVNLEIEVASELERDSLYKQLADHVAIKMVL